MLNAWRGMWICVRAVRNAQKQLARTSLNTAVPPGVICTLAAGFTRWTSTLGRTNEAQDETEMKPRESRVLQQRCLCALNCLCFRHIAVYCLADCLVFSTPSCDHFGCHGEWKKIFGDKNSGESRQLVTNRLKEKLT